MESFRFGKAVQRVVVAGASIPRLGPIGHAAPMANDVMARITHSPSVMGGRPCLRVASAAPRRHPALYTANIA